MSLANQPHESLIRLVKRVIDLAIIIFSAYLAYLWRFSAESPLTNAYSIAILLGCVIGFLVFTALAKNDGPMRLSITHQVKKTFIAWALITLILLLFAFATKTGAHFSRIWLFQWMGVGFCLSLITRLVYQFTLIRRRKKGLGLRKVLVVGSTELLTKLENKLEHVEDEGFQITETLDCEKTPIEGEIDLNNINEVWLAVPATQVELRRSLFKSLRFTTQTVRIIPDIFDLPLLNYSVSTIGGLPFLNIRNQPMRGVDRALKYIEDKVFGVIILICISWLLVILAVLVKLSSKGPVLFKQKRYGLDGKVINVYKFRSMKLHTEKEGQITQAKADDERFTKIGKFMRKTSLDELPQFFNVLQGKMSIVGPRPHAVEHNELYKDQVAQYMQRHMVKPGITGWAQINGFRGETDTLEKMEKRVEYDLYYIENWSLWFDIKIILLTIIKGFINKNAY